MRDRPVCWMHGGKGGRPPIHGRCTKAAKASRRERREARAILRAVRELLALAD